MAAVVDPLLAELDLLLRAVRPLVTSTADALVTGVARDDDLSRWAGSGAMQLTGDPAGPPQAPGAPVASRLAAAGLLFEQLSARLGTPVDVDAPALLGERAALRGLTRRGTVSAGGSCRLLPSADGWLAVSLPRDDDWTLAGAWLRRELAAGQWEEVAAAVTASRSAELVPPAAELGLAVGALPGGRHSAGPALVPWRARRGVGQRPQAAPLRVVDLSTLWAGPLCAQLLGQAGCDVTTVEDPDRPDGARRGDPRLHALLHAGHASVPVRLSTPTGRRTLHDLVAGADVVITSARRRALVQLDLDPARVVAEQPGLTWVAITGHGLASNRVGFGDDAAVAGGLAVVPAGPGEPPHFCADAVADPATGLYAAVAGAATALHGGGLVDIALRDVAAHLARGPRMRRPDARWDGRQWVVPAAGGPVAVAAPRARLLSRA